jgi:threonine dehydratase
MSTISLPLTRDSIIAAHNLIKPHIHTTPVLTNTTLSNLASTPQSCEALKGTQWEGREPAKPKIRLFFKAENFQKIGAFKVRGAFHAVLRLIEERGIDDVRKKAWLRIVLVCFVLSHIRPEKAYMPAAK